MNKLLVIGNAAEIETLAGGIAFMLVLASLKYTRINIFSVNDAVVSSKIHPIHGWTKAVCRVYMDYGSWVMEL